MSEQFFIIIKDNGDFNSEEFPTIEEAVENADPDNGDSRIIDVSGGMVEYYDLEGTKIDYYQPIVNETPDYLEWLYEGCADA